MASSEISATLAVACQNFSTDQGGRVTLHELTDQLMSTGFPARVSRLYAIFGLLKETPGILIANRVEVLDGAGSIIATMDFPDIVFRADQPMQRMMANLSGVTWPVAGRYNIQLVSRGTVIATFPFYFLQAQFPGPPPTA